MSFFSSPVVSPPSVAIREANTHIQTLFDENLRLEKDIYDLRQIIEEKTVREEQMLCIEQGLREDILTLKNEHNLEKESWKKHEEKECDEKVDSEKQAVEAVVEVC